MIYIIIILTILLLISAYIIYNLYQKLELLEVELEKMNNNSTSFYNIIFGVLVKLHKDLTDIDHKGIFESDDDVGFVFKAIVSLIENVKTFLKDLN